MGFSVPLAHWFRTDLQDAARAAARSGRLLDTGWFDAGALRGAVEAHVARNQRQQPADLAAADVRAVAGSSGRDRDGLSKRLMHRRGVLIAGMGAACLPLLAARAQALSDPFIDVVRRVRQSVVAIARVEVERNTVPAVMGTAFVVGDGRHLITNAHVAAPAGGGPVAGIHALVRLGSGTDRRRAHIVEVVPEADLALLSIDGPALPALTVRSDPELLPEGTAVAIPDSRSGWRWVRCQRRTAELSPRSHPTPASWRIRADWTQRSSR